MSRVLHKAIDALSEFLGLEAAGGLILMGASVLGLIVANSPLSGLYTEFLELPVVVQFGTFKIAKPHSLWINDGLMAIFFLLVGLELKREILEGHLSSLRKASLPFFAAVGGMAAPALFYVALNRGDAEAMRGWAIPAATDIAFALGVLTLLGPRVPTVLKAFLLSIAIFDDMGAIIIIAIFYTADLSLPALIIAGSLLAGLVVLNRSGVTKTTGYLIIGALLWAAVLKSGVHATLAGLAVALAIPLRGGTDDGGEGAAPDHGADRSPLRRLEHALHPWVAFGVLPLFGFANAGVPLAGLSASDLVHPVPLGIVLGLLLGKPIGILAMSWLAVRFGIASLAEGVRWRDVLGTGILCGTGFTMSFFIASLAFEQGGGALHGLDRLGILVGSFLSGLLGYFTLRRTLRPPSGAR